MLPNNLLLKRDYSESVETETFKNLKESSINE
jgi:hypothetical protein